MSLKLLGKNAVIYAIGNVCVRAASLLLIPLYTHSLSIRDYGLLTTLLISIQLMVIFMSVGMRTALLRFAKEYELDNRIGDLLGTSSSINLLAGLMVASASFAFLVPFFRSILHTDHVHSYMGMACCAALLQSLSFHIMTYYRAWNQALKFMITGISTALILFVVNFVLLYVLKLGIIGALSALITTYTVILLFLSIDVFSRTGIGISVSLAQKLLRFGFPLVFSMSGEIIIGGASIYFLSYFFGLEVVAVYSLGYKFAQILGMTVVLPFSLAFLPYVFTNLDSQGIKEKISRALTYLVLATAFMSVCILLGSRILLPLIAPPEYSSAFLVTLLLLPGIAFLGPLRFGETLLTIVKKTHIVGFTMIICAILSVILNYTLIPFVNWYGAVIALNTSFILAGSALVNFGISKFPVPIEWKRLCITASLVIFFLFVFFILRDIDLALFSVITLLTVLGSVSILLCSGFFHNDEIVAMRNLSLRFR